MRTSPNMRLARVRQALQDSFTLPRGKRLDALVVSQITNAGYLSGFTGSAALLLITREEAFFLTDSRYTAQARAECVGFDVIGTGFSGSVEPLGTLLADRPMIQRIGFEAGHVTVAALALWKKKAPAGRTWVATEGIVERMRLVKDEDEIARIRKAVRIAEEGFARIRPRIQAGVTERELALALEIEMRELGSDAMPFEIIVASGPNGAFPHHHPTGRALAAGDLVTIDWGARAEGYVSDLTRTVLVPGAPADEKLLEVHGIVQEAKERAIAAIRPGVTGKEIDAVARDYIAERGYGEYFGHSLGHSIGRTVHDGATLSVRSDKIVLEPRVITTVEPGIYIEGLGGVRIEEDVLVTASGHEVLTTEEKSGLRAA